MAHTGEVAEDSSPQDSSGEPMRQLGAFRAFVASFLGLGLGYVYVGRLSVAAAVVGVTYGSLAVIGWTRLILVPAGVYTLLAVLAAVALTNLIHPIVLACCYAGQPRKPYNRWWVYCLWGLGSSVAAITFLQERANLFGYDTFRAASESMSPTLERGDYFLIDPWRFRSHAPTVGEIVVYETQRRPGIAFVKRIVGVPGDRVEGRAGVLYRNGTAVAEPFLRVPNNVRVFGRDFGPVELQPDEYFVLGDFRDNSVDSRMDGPVPRSMLRGRAEYIWYSSGEGGIRWQRFPKMLQ